MVVRCRNAPYPVLAFATAKDYNRRVGLLYWKSGQTENEAFANQMSPELDEFLNFFGERVRLKVMTNSRWRILDGEFSAFFAGWLGGCVCDGVCVCVCVMVCVCV